MRLTPLDLLLLLMVVIWGANFSVVKYALRDFPEISFNAFRLLLATAVFLALIARIRRHAAATLSPLPALTRPDLARMAFLGLVGHFLYQLCFLAGVARTSVGNSSLIFGCTPVTVALMAAVGGHERVPRLGWVGALLSLGGVYAIIGHRAAWSQATLAGDLLIFGGMLCWSLYSVVSQPLLARHSPLVVTGLSMAMGAVLYMVVAVPSFLTTDWRAISGLSWMLMAASSLLALAFAYIVWYTAVQRIGSARTAIYSNLTPIVAIIVAAVTLGEPIERVQVLGAAAILGGVFVTRWAGSTLPRPS